MKDMEPLVSVLVSVYNGEKVIEDTLTSVIRQSYTNLQIIVVDDCSTDGSRAVIDRIAATDERIQTLYLKENGNMCKASNAGFQLVRGKYLALIGHDDVWKADKLKKQVQFMEANTEYAVCFTLCDIIDEEGRICNEQMQSLYQLFDQRNRSQKEWVEILLFAYNVFCASSALLRRECLKGDRLYHFGMLQLQDMALWLELLAEWSVYVLQERLTLYRRFLQSDSNLSALSETSQRRLQHENSYLRFRYINELPDEKLCMLLRQRFRDKNAKTEMELKCERAFMLMESGELHSIDLFFELFDCEETRTLLEQHYHFRLKDFYEYNARSFSYDNTPIIQMQRASEALEQYAALVESQGKMLEQQQSVIEKLQKH